MQTLGCSRRTSTITHIYPSVLQAVSGRGYTGCLDGCFQGYQGEPMQDLGNELPRISIPRTWVNKPLYKRRRGDPLRSPLLLLWGLGPPAKPAWGSYIDPPRAYLLTGCGPPFSMPLACCRRDSLGSRRQRRRRGVTVFPGFYAAIDVKLQCVWLPPLEVIDVKVCCRVSVVRV
jgi:hypothetical protein